MRETVHHLVNTKNHLHIICYQRKEPFYLFIYHVDRCSRIICFDRTLTRKRECDEEMVVRELIFFGRFCLEFRRVRYKFRVF